MTTARKIAERFVAKKAKNVTASGETVYTVSVAELAELLAATQRNAIEIDLRGDRLLRKLAGFIRRNCATIADWRDSNEPWRLLAETNNYLEALPKRRRSL